MSKYQVVDTDTTPNTTVDIDVWNAIHGPNLDFLNAASKALGEFKKSWKAEHAGDAYAVGLELDYIPATYDGEIFGFFIISEIDGESYDYAPARHTREAK